MDEYAAELHPPKQDAADKETSHSADDLDLENAIGDAFKQFAMLNESHDSSSHGFDQSADSPPDAKHADIETVVGDVFGSFSQHAFEDAHKPADHADFPVDQMFSQDGTGSEPKQPLHDISSHEAAPEKTEQAPVYSQEAPSGASGASLSEDTDHAKDEANVDLEAAIGDAFKSLSAEAGGAKGFSADAFSAKAQNEHQGSESNSEDQNLEDQNLEDAIGEVFQNLAKSEDVDKGTHDQQPVASEPKASEDTTGLNADELLRQAITQSLNSIYDSKKPQEQPAESKDSAGLNLAGIVQDVVGRIHTSDANPEGSKGRQNFIDELAGEISHKVNSERSSKDIPVLDETVLAHFQTVANKEDQSLDSAIKSAVASAVNTATSQTEPKAQVPAVDNESDLEKLHMNEILQNAFNMAMSNPQELITSLDIDEPTSAQKSASSDAQSEQTLSTAAAIAALSVKDALARKDASTSVEPKEKTTKPLSIAQTLALHRASMAGTAKRDYSAIQTLEDSMKQESSSSVQMNPQLSNILSSLSHHIQSGTQSQNLMSVIRQMTNALMLTKSSISVTKRVQDLVQEFKKSPDAERSCLEDLKGGKRLLGTIEDSQRAQTLLSSVIGYIRPQEKTISDVKLEDDLSQPEQKQLKDIYDCAHGAISSYSNSRLRAALAGVKRDMDSSEYKERVRTENRERKKKWREENAERNKDNDLRARVLRRAAYMFGEGNSEEKTLWMEDEFSKRREKRFARQQKEENSEHGVSDSSTTDKSKSASLQNPKLTAMIGNYVHLVGESGSEMIPEAALAATCAVVSVAVTRYANEIGVKDMKQILSAVTSVLNSILDASVRSGEYLKLPFLVKTEVSDKNKDLKEKYSALIESRGAGEAAQLRDAQKRAYGDILEEAKRKKTEDFATSFVKTELDQGQPKLANASTSWSAASGLKMPHYRKPLGHSDTHQPNEQVRDAAVLSKPALSPFISNKVGKDAAVAAPSGLRKPGSFQRPAYARPSKAAGGFSALYSTSFKQN